MDLITERDSWYEQAGLLDLRSSLSLVICEPDNRLNRRRGSRKSLGV